MRILTVSEQETFDRPPLFDHRERKKFFECPKALLDIAQSMRSPDHQVGFLVSCGYFQATRRFFVHADFEPRDVAYVANQLGTNDTSTNTYPDRTRQRHRQRILDFYGFTPLDDEAEATLAVEIATMARTHLKPRLIFDRCVDFLIQRRVQVPKSGVLLELIRSGLHTRKAELIALMDAHLIDEARNLLDDLFATPDDQNRYRLTLLKKLSQSTKPMRIKEDVADFETMTALYVQLESILSVLDLGVAGVRYYAGSVLKSEVFQIKRREANDRYVHAAAFVARQFFRKQDNLIDLWLSVMASFKSTAEREHREKLLEDRNEQQEQLKSVVDDLDASVFGLIRGIRGVTDAAGLSDTQKIAAIQTLLDRVQSGTFDRLKADLCDTTQDRSWHDVLEARSLWLQNRLSPILQALTFDRNERAAPLIAAIDHFKASDGSIGARAPVDFLNTDERVALIRADGTLRTSLYRAPRFLTVFATMWQVMQPEAHRRPSAARLLRQV
jgi:hypothetical protein